MNVVQNCVYKKLRFPASRLIEYFRNLLMPRISAAELDGGLINIFLCHSHHPIQAALNNSSQPFVLAEISSTKVGAPTLPDTSICFFSRIEPPPTNTILPERRSIIRSQKQIPHVFTMYDMLRAWNKVARKYRNGEITKEDYDNWRYNYPESNTK